MQPTRFTLASAALVMLAAPSAFARDPRPLPTEASYLKAFQTTILAQHNAYRAQHGVPPLKWSDALAKYARSRASTLVREEGLNAGHAGLASGYGENLYWAGSSGTGSALPSASAAAERSVKSWYDEIKDYSFSKAAFSPQVGHFTQLVWKNTTEVGCVLYPLQGSQWLETYVVCNYQAPGNVMGQFQANVLPRKK